MKSTLAPRSQSIALIVSVALTAVILWYLFTTISFEQVVTTIRNANRDIVAAFLVASLSSSFFRMWRYRVLLRANGYPTPIPSMFLVVLIRNTFSDLLPARLGTLIYIFLVRTRLGIPLSAGASSFALAFLFDVLAIVPLVVLCVLLTGGGHGFSPLGLSLGAVALALVTGTMIYCLPALCRWSSRVITLAPAIPGRLRTSLVELVTSTAAGIQETQSAGVYGQVLVLSVLIRFGKYLGLYLFLYALLQPKGYSLAELPFPSIFLGLVGAELAASLPISGIAGFGAYQGAWVTVFTLLGFPLELAKLTSISHHLFTQAYGYGLGAAAFLLILLPLFRRDEGQKDTSNRRSPNVIFAVLVCFSVFLVGAALSLILATV